MMSESSDSREQASERLRRRERQLAAVYRITSALNARTNLDELERQTLDAAIQTVDATAGSILLYDPAKDALLFRYVVSPDPAIAEQLMKIELKPGQGICGQVFQTGKGRITFDVTTDRDHEKAVDERTGFQTLSMVTMPLQSTDGQPIGVMQVCNKPSGAFDEDDMQVLEILSIIAASAIETARLHQQARLAVIVNLIGDISHDVKNLVTPVVTGTQTLQWMLDGMYEELDTALTSRDPVPGEAVREATGDVRSFYPEAVEMTYEGAQAVQERVREIADAIKGIISEPHFELIRINEVAELVAKFLRGTAERSGVTIDLSELGDAPPVEIDRKRMYNALYNLINNAIPETPAGGKISLHARMISDEARPQLEIRVRDTGRGMPARVRESLFTDHTETTKVGGTGLGTRIVRNVVEAHNGTISVHSEEGRGTEFVIRIPMRQDKADS